MPLPSGHELWSVTPQIAYLTIPGAFVAVLTWNAAIAKLGPQNTVLFGNLIPVTTFAIEIARGYRPDAAELAGAALTIGALVANNLLARRRPRRERVAERELELAGAGLSANASRALGRRLRPWKARPLWASPPYAGCGAAPVVAAVFARVAAALGFVAAALPSALAARRRSAGPEASSSSNGPITARWSLPRGRSGPARRAGRPRR